MAQNWKWKCSGDRFDDEGFINGRRLIKRNQTGSTLLKKTHKQAKNSDDGQKQLNSAKRLKKLKIAVGNGKNGSRGHDLIWH